MNSSQNAIRTGIIFDKVGIYLLAITAIYVIAASFPFNIKDPGWLAKIIATFNSTAIFLLIAAVLIALAGIFAPDSKSVNSHYLRLKKAAPLIALLFIVLIPVQGGLALKASDLARENATKDMRSLQGTLFQLRTAQNPEDFEAAVKKLPGAPPNYVLKMPIEEARRALLTQLEPQVKQLELTGLKNHAAVHQKILIEWLRDSLVMLANALIFRAFGKLPEDKQPLIDLTQLMHEGDTIP